MLSYVEIIFELVSWASKQNFIYLAQFILKQEERKYFPVDFQHDFHVLQDFSIWISLLHVSDT